FIVDRFRNFTHRQLHIEIVDQRLNFFFGLRATPTGGGSRRRGLLLLRRHRVLIVVHHLLHHLVHHLLLLHHLLLHHRQLLVILLLLCPPTERRAKLLPDPKPYTSACHSTAKPFVLCGGQTNIEALLTFQNLKP